MTGLNRLKERREERCLKFALKTAQNDRFSGWFPLNTNDRVVRHRNRYCETLAKTSRLYNSPVFDLRSRLNRLR